MRRRVHGRRFSPDPLGRARLIADFLERWGPWARLVGMSPVTIMGFSLLERWVEAPVPCLDALAQAYVEATRRTRPRPMAVHTRYRFPRGRRTDGVPVSAVVARTRG